MVGERRAEARTALDTDLAIEIVMLRHEVAVLRGPLG